MPMYWWIPDSASKPREKPQLHILSTWDTIFCLQQAPGPLLAALPYRAPVAVRSTRFWAKGNAEYLRQGSTQLQGQAGLLRMLGSREAISPPQPSRMPTWLEVKVSTLAPSFFSSKAVSSLPSLEVLPLWGLRDPFKFPLLHLAKWSILSLSNGLLSN